MNSRSRLIQYVGILAFVVGVVGFVVFGWRFGSNGSPVESFLGVAGAVLAVVLVVGRYLSEQ